MIPAFRSAVWPLLAVTVLLTVPAHAQKEQKAAIEAAAQKAIAAGQHTVGAAPKSTSPQCSAPKDLAHLDRPLVRTARLLAAGLPIRIIALGSSSTAGAGASSPDASYPNRLAAELRERFPDHEITVVNRGVNGDEAADMLARFEQTVVAEQPDLVLWQVGTNSVLRDNPIGPNSLLIEKGLERLKEIGADVVLIDPQFAPKVISKGTLTRMLELLAFKAKQFNVNLFQRFAIMRDWREHQGIPFETFVSADQLHMNDWSYACWAKVMGVAIAEAATRPAATAAAHAAPPIRP